MSRRDGFTLLESLVALVLAGVLLGSSVVALTALLESARLAGAARSLAATLRLARGRALAGGSTVEARFDPGRSLYEIGSAAAPEVHSLPPSVRFAGLPARGRLVFGALGTAENGTVTLGAGPRQRSVVVNQRGRVRLQ